MARPIAKGLLWGPKVGYRRNLGRLKRIRWAHTAIMAPCMPSEDKGAPPPKVRVLVADDEEMIASTLATILELAGYEVCAVYGGEAALRLLDLFKPDLVITDIMMPGVTGVEVAFAARAALPRCKVLMFSSHAGLHDLLRANQQEGLAFDLITKPIRPEDLLALLKETLRSESPALLVPIEVDEEHIH